MPPPDPWANALLHWLWEWLQQGNNAAAVAIPVMIAIPALGWLLHRWLSRHITPDPSVRDIQQEASNGQTAMVTGSGELTQIGRDGITQHAPGNIYVTNISGISAEEYWALSKQLGVTEAGLKSFFKILSAVNCCSAVAVQAI